VEAEVKDAFRELEEMEKGEKNSFCAFKYREK
jgi:hypothetical protein